MHQRKTFSAGRSGCTPGDGEGDALAEAEELRAEARQRGMAEAGRMISCAIPGSQSLYQCPWQSGLGGEPSHCAQLVGKNPANATGTMDIRLLLPALRPVLGRSKQHTRARGVARHGAGTGRRAPGGWATGAGARRGAGAAAQAGAIAGRGAAARAQGGFQGCPEALLEEMLPVAASSTAGVSAATTKGQAGATACGFWIGQDKSLQCSMAKERVLEMEVTGECAAAQSAQERRTVPSA